MWTVIGGPVLESDPPDGVVAWTWVIAKGREQRTLRVYVAHDVRGAAAVSEASQLATSLAGRPAFEPYLGDEDPPTSYEIGADAVVALRP